MGRVLGPLRPQQRQQPALLDDRPADRGLAASRRRTTRCRSSSTRRCPAGRSSASSRGRRTTGRCRPTGSRATRAATRPRRSSPAYAGPDGELTIVGLDTNGRNLNAVSTAPPGHTASAGCPRTRRSTSPSGMPPATARLDRRHGHDERGRRRPLRGAAPRGLRADDRSPWRSPQRPRPGDSPRDLARAALNPPLRALDAAVHCRREIPPPQSAAVDPGAHRRGRVLAERARYVPRGVSTPSLVVARAEGARIEDVDGRTYIDFAGGIGCQNTGHRAESVAAAIHAQVDRYLHQCFMVGTYEPYVEVCRRLAELWPGERETRSRSCSTPAPRPSRTRSRSRAPRPDARRS